jgi:hypothetical protein
MICLVIIGQDVSHVKDCDLDEVRVIFAINVAHLEYADNFRIFPLNMSEEYMAKRNLGCCGSWNIQFKCLSGNIYWIGCNYGH